MFSRFQWSFPSARLLGGKSTSQGLVQVSYNKTWGWVCADQWDKQDADVACRMMGFDGSLSSFKENEERNKTKYHAWLNNMQCIGNESSLFSCINDGLGSHDCEGKGKAGVICRPKGKIIYIYIYIYNFQTLFLVENYHAKKCTIVVLTICQFSFRRK